MCYATRGTGEMVKKASHTARTYRGREGKMDRGWCERGWIIKMKAVVNREVHRHPSLYPLLHPPPRDPRVPISFRRLSSARGLYSSVSFLLLSPRSLPPIIMRPHLWKPAGIVVGRIAMTFQICLLEDKIHAAIIKRGAACNFAIAESTFRFIREMCPPYGFTYTWQTSFE